MSDTSFLTQQEMDTFATLLGHIGRDTMSCWLCVRRGGSASLGCYGNVSVPLVELFSELASKIADEPALRRACYER
jgi:hypothetical protein